MKEFLSCKLLVPALRGDVLYEILQLLSQKLRLMFSLKQLPPDQANCYYKMLSTGLTNLYRCFARLDITE